jgi:MSHA biogenesis protein MshM
MYEDYFGLERSPFKITPDTSLFYEGGKRGDILVALAYAIHRGEGIIKVVGEVGSGKTMLCRMLQLQLPDTVEIVYIANPSVSADDILFVIAHELSLPVDKGASKHEVMHMLQDYLLQRHMENKQVVLFVEEAQGMPLETLEEIRLLSNLETDENKLLQIILFGQPELDQNLAQQSIRQLRERITHTFNLEPLTQEEIHTYLNFRMREVGYTGPELVNNAVAKKIELHSEGLLRRINIIADKILLSAFAEGTHNLSAKHVTAAVNDSTFGQVAPRQTRWFWWLIVPLLLVALAFAGYQTRTQWLPWAMTTMQTMLLADTEPAPVVDADATPSFDPSESVVASVENSVAGELSSESASASLPDQAVNTAPVPQQATVEPEQQEVEMVVVESTGVTDQPSATANQPTTVPADMESLSADINVLVSEVEVAVQQASVKAEVNPEVEPRQAASNAPKASVEVAQNAAVAAVEPAGTDSNSLTGDYRQWLNVKLEQSKYWLSNAARDNMSIQVMMRGKSAAPELVYYLRNEWPLELTDTYMYEYTVDGRSIYRIFYGEFQSLSAAKSQIERFPESVRVNLPYVHSIYRMRKAFL